MIDYRPTILAIDRTIARGAAVTFGDDARQAIVDAGNTRNMHDTELFEAARRIMAALPAEFPLTWEKQAI